MKFSSNKIFDNSNVNAILDRIWYECLQVNANVNDLICLSGRAGDNLQKPEAEWQPCKNIIIVVKDDELYSFIMSSLGNLIKNKGVIKFNERILFYFDDFYLEFWKITDADIYQLSVPVHRSGDIPQILL